MSKKTLKNFKNFVLKETGVETCGEFYQISDAHLSFLNILKNLRAEDVKDVDAEIELTDEKWNDLKNIFRIIQEGSSTKNYQALLKAVLLDETVPDPELTTQDKKHILEVLSTLTYREEDIIRSSFGLERRKLGQKELSEKFSVSTSRIGQIKNKALRKLRHPSRKKILKRTELLALKNDLKYSQAECENYKEKNDYLYSIKQQLEIWLRLILRGLAIASCDLVDLLVSKKEQLEPFITEAYIDFSFDDAVKNLDEYSKKLQEQNAKYSERIQQEANDKIARLKEKATFYNVDFEYLKKHAEFCNVSIETFFLSIDELNLSVRPYNALQRNKIFRVIELIQRTEDELLKMKNFGKKSLSQIKEALKKLGLRLGMRIEKIK